jgi:hypothetical protein
MSLENGQPLGPYEEADPKTKTDLWILPMFGDRRPVRLLGTPFNERNASFSRDGRWIAYDSDETGQNQVYVQSFPASGGKWQVSAGTRTGSHTRWRPGGKEMIYDSSGTLMAVDLTGTVAGREFKAGIPRQMVTGLVPLNPHNYDLSPGGDRFLVVTNRDLSASQDAPIVVVVNWKSGLRQ